MSSFGEITFEREGFNWLKPGYYRFERSDGSNFYGKLTRATDDGSFLCFERFLLSTYTDRGFVLAERRGPGFFATGTFVSWMPSSRKEFETALRSAVFLQNHLGRFINLIYDDGTSYSGKISQLRKTTLLLSPVIIQGRDENGFPAPYIESKHPIELSFNGLHLIQPLLDGRKGLEELLEQQEELAEKYKLAQLKEKEDGP